MNPIWPPTIPQYGLLLFCFSGMESARNHAPYCCTLQQCSHFWQLAPMKDHTCPKYWWLFCPKSCNFFEIGFFNYKKNDYHVFSAFRWCQYFLVGLFPWLLRADLVCLKNYNVLLNFETQLQNKVQNNEKNRWFYMKFSTVIPYHWNAFIGIHN